MLKRIGQCGCAKREINGSPVLEAKKSESSELSEKQDAGSDFQLRRDGPKVVAAKRILP
jgi:hypothetical protein